MTSPSHVLVIEDAYKTFVSGESRVEALRGVSLVIEQGETVALVGPSGSGKSTLLSLGAGLELVDRGRVVLDGHELGLLDEDERAVLRNRTLGFVYQNFQLLPTFTALENVTLPMELLGGESYQVACERARELLSLVGLADRTTHYPLQLSGGEQQRVAIARALVTSPKLILADEPTGNLDRNNAESVLELMTGLSQRYGSALVMVTHDLEVASVMDRQIRLRDGLIQ